MSDLSVEEILRDLLDSNLEKRENALNQMRKNWNLQYRPYIWTAIENEANREFQFEIVRFIVSKLKEKSMRKMIRFIEKGQLFPKARKEVIKNFFVYLNEDITIALIKSLNRAGSHIFNFLKDLLGSKFINELSSEMILVFLKRIFHELEDSRRISELVEVLYRRKETANTGKMKSVILQDSELLEDEQVLRGILQSLNRNANARREFNVIWDDQNWSEIQRSSLRNNELLIIRSLKHPNPSIRREAILFVGEIRNRFPLVDIQIITQDQLKIIDEVIELLYLKNYDEKFQDLERYDEQSLNEFFSQDELLEDKNYFYEIKTWEIHPYILLNSILCRYPRRLLLRMLTDDPSQKNRETAYLKLNQIHLWEDQHTKKLITPHSSFLDYLKTAYRGLANEHDNLKSVLSTTITDFMRSLSASTEFTRILSIFASSPLIKAYQEDFENIFVQHSLIELFLILGDEVKVVELVRNQTDDGIIQILDDLLEKIEFYNDLLTELMTERPVRIQLDVLQKADEFLAAQYALTQKEKAFENLVRIGIDSKNVKVRTISRFVLKKFYENGPGGI